MQDLKPNVLQNIARFLSLRELLCSFEPLCRSSKDTVAELCRQMKTLRLGGNSNMTDSDFLLLLRRCCDITALSIDYSPHMKCCHQDLWEATIYCPKLQIIIVHGSPVFPSEFGEEVVSRLAVLDASIPNIYQDTREINVYHMFCSTRIVELVTYFQLQNSPVTQSVWSLIKYVLSMKDVMDALSSICLDHIVVCSFYAVCKVYAINVTFHTILQWYSEYLAAFASLGKLLGWGDVNKLWFNIQYHTSDKHEDYPSMVEFYNSFFVPKVYPLIHTWYRNEEE